MTSLETESPQVTNSDAVAFYVDPPSSVAVWYNTTHQWLYDKSSSCTKKIVAIFILLLQFYIYAVSVMWGIREYNNNRTSRFRVPVTFDTHGSTAEQSCGVSGVNATLDNFNCSYVNADTDMNGPLIAIILIICFLISDFVKAIKTFCNNPFVSIVLILEVFAAVGATVSIGLGKFGHGVDSSTVEIIFVSVAIIFVHDIDEKIYEAISVCSKK